MQYLDRNIRTFACCYLGKLIRRLQSALGHNAILLPSRLKVFVNVRTVKVQNISIKIPL
jgi:hypothetical protein